MGHSKEEATVLITAICQPGTTVYCVLRHLSTTGMQREIALYAITPDDRTKVPYLFDLTFLAAKTTERAIGKHDGIKVRGCGVDTGHELVDDLNRALGFKADDRLHHSWI